MSKYKKIFGDEWYEALKPFLESDDFKKIGEEIKEKQNAGTRIYPLLDEVFRPFKECPLSKVVTVFLTTNPYVKGQADGLAFSSRESKSIFDVPQVLRKIFDAIEEDVADGLYVDRNTDLTRWANQGVLLLNMDLTTERNKPGEHIKLWKPFIDYVIKVLLKKATGVIFILIGTQAMKYSKHMNPLNTDFYVVEHPMLAVKNKRDWDHREIFSTVNRISNFIHNKQIQWTSSNF